MNKKSITYFISGHGNITQEEFDTYYKPRLKVLYENEKEIHFIVGDFVGVDILAQNYLLDELNIDPNILTIYHVGNEPKNINPKVVNVIGGFKDFVECDIAMTKASKEDIAYIREGSECSETAMNVIRRHQFNFVKPIEEI